MVSVVKIFLEQGADVDATDIDNNTALHYAYAYAKLMIVPILEAAGAESSALNLLGKTPDGILGAGMKGLRPSSRHRCNPSRSPTSLPGASGRGLK
jgi:ankyrin repeat protein